MKKIEHKIGVFFVVITFFIFGFFISKKHTPMQHKDLSSEASGLFNKDSFINYINEKKVLLQDQSFYKTENCVRELNDIYSTINSLKVSDFDKANVHQNFYEIIKVLFDFRIEIRKSFQAEYFRNKVSQECAFEHRKLFRSMRVIEDFIGMVGVGVIRAPAAADGGKKEEKEDFYRVFKGKKENFMWNKDYPQTDDLKYTPQSGDVLLSRGSATVSAAIARITEEDSNFSHIGMVYIDPVTKKVETIEAHIEYGTLVADISEYSDMKVRSLVFRFNDPKNTKEENAKIAHEAAKKVREQMLSYQKKYKYSKYANVCYDFSMNVDNPIVIEPSDDPKNRKCLFCSEVVSLGFSLVQNGKYKVPTYFSPITPKNRKFIEDIGVNVTKTFAPADIEIDPYFDLVLEWRDYIRVHKSHRLDAVLTAVYDWMDSYKYQFFVPKNIGTKTDFGYVARRLPIFDILTGVKDKFPLNMTKGGINAMQMIDLSANALNNLLVDKEEKNKVMYTHKEMVNILNAWRLSDLAEYEAREANKVYGTDKDPYRDYRVHDFFRAPVK